MGVVGEDRNAGMKPIKPLAVRYSDTRRTLKYYKEQLKFKSKRSRLLIMAISDKLNEEEVEIVKIREESDLKLSSIWQQLLLLQGNLSKEQVRVSQVLQDKENIIQSQRQEIQRLRHALEAARVNSQQGSFRRQKRERSVVIPQSSSTDDSSSSPGSTPKQRQLTRTVSNDNHKEENSQDTKNSVNLSRQGKFTKGCERPKLKQTNSNSSITEEVKTPKGILKPAVMGVGVKPPVPSRTKINEILRGGSTSSDECLGGRIIKNPALPPKPLAGAESPQESSESSKVGRYSLNRDSGNSSLDSSDPSSSIEWKLSVRSTLPHISPGPRLEKRTKPPPPPRRSKSYERPINNNNNNTVNNNHPDIQSNFEEYDLSHMMDTSSKLTGVRKKVSFQEEEEPGNLRKMPSTPSLTGETQPQTLARTMFFPPNSTTPTFTSFKSETIQSLDSSSVLSKLLKDSLVSKLETGVSEVVDENLNITNIVRGDCKYYF